MTNAITYEGRTFTLDEDYEHPRWGRVRFVAFNTDSYGYFRDKRGYTLMLRYDSFPPPEPEPEPETVEMTWTGVAGETDADGHRIEPFFTREQRAAVKALIEELER